jgi:hypothetical protein
MPQIVEVLRYIRALNSGMDLLAFRNLKRNKHFLSFSRSSAFGHQLATLTSSHPEELVVTVNKAG